MKREGFSGSFWPTATQESLLRLVLGADEDVAARWHALQPLDIDHLDTGSFCLLPSLSLRLQRSVPDEPLVPRLAGTYRSTWVRNQLQFERLVEIAGSLRERGLRTVVFGGASLASEWYPQLGLRPMPQIDIAVQPGEGAAARSAMEAAGWRLESRGRHYERFRHPDSFVLVAHEGFPPHVAGSLDAGRVFDALLARTTERELQKALVATLDASDELVLTCVLGARTVVPPSVQWLLDAACILDRPDRLDSDQLVERIRALHAVMPVRETLAYLTEIAEMPAVDSLRTALGGHAVRPRDRHAYRLAGTHAAQLAGVPHSLGHHLRSTSDRSLAHVLAGLPGVAARKLARVARRSHAE